MLAAWAPPPAPGTCYLGALAACAQITCQIVASAMNILTQSIEATAEGDLDLAGTLGVSKEARVGFENIRLILKIDAPAATPEQIDSLCAKTEQYCVVMQTLKYPPNLSTEWVRGTENATE